jgi:hypothetical protein
VGGGGGPPRQAGRQVQQQQDNTNVGLRFLPGLIAAGVIMQCIVNMHYHHSFLVERDTWPMRLVPASNSVRLELLMWIVHLTRSTETACILVCRVQ